MGRSPSAPLKSPEDILLTKCRCYVVRKRYFQLTVFSKWWTEVDILRNAYDGHVYKHGSGYLWLLTNREDVVKLCHSLILSFPSQYLFEEKVLSIYPIKNDSP